MEKSIRILGIWDGHNSGAALLQDGKITSCISEERFSRIKNDAGYPLKSVEKILEIENITTESIDLIVLGSNIVHERDFYFRGWDWYKQSPSGDENSINNAIKKLEARNEERRNSIAQHLGVSINKIKIVDHHEAHAASAYFGSEWEFDEKILVLTCDGGGDGICATVNIGNKKILERISQTPSNASLGKIYSRITLLLGMKPWEHEYKIMGLAPYADPKGVKKSLDVFSQLIEIKENELEFSLKSELSMNYCYNFLKIKLENHRFDWIAGAVQQFTEDLLVQWVKNAIKKTGIKKIACAGGVFMNVKANMKILDIPEVEDIFVFPSGGDESIPIGAAYLGYYNILSSPNSNKIPIGPLYLGPEFSDKEIKQSINELNIEDNSDYQVEYYENINSIIAKKLSDGDIVARFFGKMEWGARALGNRSILSNPSSMTSVREINAAIKQRDFWMPFAPSMLSDKQNELIINSKHVKSHYMTMTFPTQPNQDAKIIASVHPYDLTTRSQLLEEDYNPEYYDLIKKFYEFTGIPAILNTSFNLHGEPIVCTPTDAINTLIKSGLRYLAIGHYLISKN